MADASMDAGNISLELDASAPANGTKMDGGHLNGASDVVYQQLRPHLIVKAPHAGDAIEFYKNAFGAEEVAKSLHPKRKADQEVPLILHAHLKFGGAEIMVCDEAEETGPAVKSPAAVQATTLILHLLTNNVDAAFARAIKAGAKVTEEICDQPWGQRYGKLVDPYGFVWSIATPTSALPAAGEDVPQIAVL